jgi:hypothetical protein
VDPILYFFGTIWNKSVLNLVLIYHDAKTAPPNGAIWDEFIEQH